MAATAALTGADAAILGSERAMGANGDCGTRASNRSANVPFSMWLANAGFANGACAIFGTVAPTAPGAAEGVGVTGCCGVQEFVDSIAFLWSSRRWTMSNDGEHA